MNNVKILRYVLQVSAKIENAMSREPFAPTKTCAKTLNAIAKEEYVSLKNNVTS